MAMVAAAACCRRCRCFCAAAAMLLVLPAVVVAAAAAAGDGGFITWDDLSIPAAAASASVADGGVGGRGGVKAAAGGRARALDTIVVSQDGTGHSRTVQGAVDMVPAGNRRRVKILVRPGVYRSVRALPDRSRPPAAAPRCLLCLHCRLPPFSCTLVVTASALMGGIK